MRIPYKPLPAIQPECPEHWSAEAWENRYVYGDSEYHIFASTTSKDLFALKVSGKKDDNGRWVYEDLDPLFEASLHPFIRRMLDKYSASRLTGPQE